MVKLRRIFESDLYLESKQVGTLYHSCSAEDLTKYIIPKDILSSSGTFTNFLYGGTHWVSFTRNKKYVVKKCGDWNTQDIYLQFQVDGDKLSDNYKIKPYNDMIYDLKTQSGEKDISIPYTGYNFESEECVEGPIVNFSKYVLGIKYTLSDNANLYDVDTILSHIKALQYYSKKCGVHLQIDKNLDPNGMGSYRFHGVDVKDLDDIISISTFISNITHPLITMVNENGYPCKSSLGIIHTLSSMMEEPRSSVVKKNVKLILECLFDVSSKYKYKMFCDYSNGKVMVNNKTKLKQLISNVSKGLGRARFSLFGEEFSFNIGSIEVSVTP